MKNKLLNKIVLLSMVSCFGAQALMKRSCVLECEEQDGLIIKDINYTQYTHQENPDKDPEANVGAMYAIFKNKIPKKVGPRYPFCDSSDAKYERSCNEWGLIPANFVSSVLTDKMYSNPQYSYLRTFFQGSLKKVLQEKNQMAQKVMDASLKLHEEAEKALKDQETLRQKEVALIQEAFNKAMLAKQNEDPNPEEL